MSSIQFCGQEMHTYGYLPKIGSTAPMFVLANTALENVSLSCYKGKTILIDTFPSIETRVCFDSVMKLHEGIKGQQACKLMSVSMDLPFTLKRVAEAEGLEDVTLFSDFRNRDFGSAYGVTIEDGPLAGLLARSIIIIGPDQKVKYTELVEDIGCSPNIDQAVKAALA